MATISDAQAYYYGHFISNNAFAPLSSIASGVNLTVGDWKAIRERACQFVGEGKCSLAYMASQAWFSDGGMCLAYYAASKRGEPMRFGHGNSLGDKIYSAMIFAFDRHNKDFPAQDTIKMIDRIIANLEEHETPPTVEPTPEETKPEVREPEAVLV